MYIVIALSFLLIALSAEASAEEKKLNQLTPEAKKVFTKFLKEARKKFLGYKIIVAETYRTQERQNELYKKGRHVTAVRISKHTKRIAADIFFIENGKILAYEEAPYSELGELGESFDLRWGGRWKVPFDPGHYELKEVK